MRFLELFCGTKSMARAFEVRGHEVRTLDIDPRHRPTYCMDIMDFETETLDGWMPDGIHASPDCSAFSVQTAGRNWRFANGHYVPMTAKAETSLLFIAKAVQIIRDLEPVWFTIENPAGMLRKTGMLDSVRRDTVTYCQYGDTAQKPTDFFHDLPWKPKPPCEASAPCHTPSPRRSRNPGSTLGKPNRIERARIPAALCDEIVLAAERKYELLTTADGRFEAMHVLRDLTAFNVEAGAGFSLPDLPSNAVETRWKAVKTSYSTGNDRSDRSTNGDRSSYRQVTLEEAMTR